jgi:CRISPR-associated endonuclease Csn1
MNNYRLGLKIGDHYIGWCMMGINDKNVPINIIDQGVRVFHNGREPSRKKGLLGEPLATTRTQARSMRRNNARTRMRKIEVKKRLVQFNLLPESENEQSILNSINPLKLRSDAITTKLEPYEIGRALLYLQKRRGFKSNRKDMTKGNSNELSGMKLGISNLNKVLEAKYTLGQYLYKKFEKEMCTKFRPNFTEKDLPMYEFYASREMVEKEFMEIWESQKKYHPDLLTDEAYRAIHMAIFKQRPLKSPPKGKCRIISYEDRMEWAIPSAQHFRIIKEINNLRFTSPDSIAGSPLDHAQRKKLYNELLLKKHITFKQINKLLGFSSQYEFNLNCNGRERIDGDKVAAIMRSEDVFGIGWDNLPTEEQDRFIGRLLNHDIDDETLEYTLVKEYNLKQAQAQKIMNIALPDSVAAYGKTIITSIFPLMLEHGIQEAAAIKELSYEINSHDITKEYKYLPYYGEILEKYVNKTGNSSDPMVEKLGKVANPTIHIALNELRKLMNRLKEKHGSWPDGITIELDPIIRKGTKELLSSLKEKEKRNKKYNSWQNEIERYKGSPATKDDFLKMELWEELAEDPMHRKCVLSGRTISVSMLFSEEIRVGYILPYSKTLDGSKSNLLLMDSTLAYMKGNRTPFDAFCDVEGDYAHFNILQRAMNLPKYKQWRFRADAMEIFINKTLDTEKEKGEHSGLDIFAIKPLKDRNYNAKLFKKYLSAVCGEYNIYTTNGAFTPLLRGSFGMNDFLELRNCDYRKHTVDALVLSFTTPYMIRQISAAALLEETKGIKISKTIGGNKPFSAFNWENNRDYINNVIVSYRPDTNPASRLHEDTIFSYIKENNKNIDICIRKPITDIKNKDDINYIRLLPLREEIKQFIEGKEDINLAIKEFGAMNGTTKITILDSKPSNILVPVKNDNGRILKIAQGGSNHRAEIYQIEDKWHMEIIKTFDANQKNFIPNWKKEHPDAELIMTLHNNDMVVYEEDGIINITKVKKISGNKTVTLVPHNLTKEKEEENMWGASAKQLQLKNARKVTVKIDGTLYDPFNITHKKKDAA